MYTKEEKEVMYVLVQNIRKFRKENKHSQNVFGEKINYERDHIAKVETARRNMSMNLFFNISSALKVPEYKFFIFEEIKNTAINDFLDINTNDIKKC